MAGREARIESIPADEGGQATLRISGRQKGKNVAGSLMLSMDDAAGSGDMLSRYLEKKPDDIQAWYLVAAGAERLRKCSKIERWACRR